MRESRMVLLLLALCPIGLMLSAPPSAADPILWPFDQGGNGHYYEAVAVPEGCTWEQAALGAAASSWMGTSGYLATMTSHEENSYVCVRTGRPVGFWLGGFRQAGIPELSPHWSWVTGEAWEYTNWDTGEPDVPAQETSYLCVATDCCLWGDAFAPDRALGYLIEYELSGLPSDHATWGLIKDLFR